MRDDIPVTGNPVIDTMTRIFDWLDRQIDQLVPRPPAPPPRAAPADMTDEQLHHAIHDVGGRLLNSLAPVLQRSFAGDGAKRDPRFPHPLPTTATPSLCRDESSKALTMRSHAAAPTASPGTPSASTAI